MEGFQDLHLGPVEALQRALDADPPAGPGSEGGEIGNGGGDEVRPRVEQ
jgi:hypothetical protein